MRCDPGIENCCSETRLPYSSLSLRDTAASVRTSWCGFQIVTLPPFLSFYYHCVQKERFPHLFILPSFMNIYMYIIELICECEGMYICLCVCVCLGKQDRKHVFTCVSVCMCVPVCACMSERMHLCVPTLECICTWWPYSLTNTHIDSLPRDPFLALLPSWYDSRREESGPHYPCILSCHPVYCHQSPGHSYSAH